MVGSSNPPALSCSGNILAYYQLWIAFSYNQTNAIVASKISRRYEQVAMEYAPIPNYLRGVDEAKLNELRRTLNLPRSPDEVFSIDMFINSFKYKFAPSLEHC